MHDSGHNLTQEERTKVAYQVDYFMTLVAQKYAVSPSEVMDAVKWVKERQDFNKKLRQTGIFSLIGIIGSALMFSLWEGIKHIILSGRN